MYEAYTAGTPAITKESLKDIVGRGSLSPQDGSLGPHSPGKFLGGGSNQQGRTSSLGEGPSNQTGLTGSTSMSDRTTKELLRPPKPRQGTLKQWISYERKVDNVPGVRNVRPSALKERSALSQLNPDDEHNGCFVGCLSSMGLRPKPVFMMPSPGEDVCGICHDNKPLLAMQFCEHKASGTNAQIGRCHANLSRRKLIFVLSCPLADMPTVCQIDVLCA